MQDQQTKFNWFRRDSGELRLLIAFFFILLAGFFLWMGTSLIKEGSTGEWGIVSSFQGWTLYITSISPGLAVIGLGALILILGLPRTLKNL